MIYLATIHSNEIDDLPGGVLLASHRGQEERLLVHS
jgi:hypothetical protein